MGRRGAAATSHPLSTAIAIEVLRSGGNAIDAARTACSLQSVLEPHNTGLGGDCFALVWRADTKSLHALNGSGYAPQALSASTNGPTAFSKFRFEQISDTGKAPRIDWGRTGNHHGGRQFDSRKESRTRLPRS